MAEEHEEFDLEDIGRMALESLASQVSSYDSMFLDPDNLRPRIRGFYDYIMECVRGSAYDILYLDDFREKRPEGHAAIASLYNTSRNHAKICASIFLEEPGILITRNAEPQDEVLGEILEKIRGKRISLDGKVS